MLIWTDECLIGRHRRSSKPMSVITRPMNLSYEYRIHVYPANLGSFMWLTWVVTRLIQISRVTTHVNHMKHASSICVTYAFFICVGSMSTQQISDPRLPTLISSTQQSDLYFTWCLSASQHNVPSQEGHRGIYNRGSARQKYSPMALVWGGMMLGWR